MSQPILFIFVTIVIDAIGLGIIFPVLPDLLIELLGSTTAHAALWGGVLTVSYAMTQFLFGPFIGSLSDRVGRRPVLLISLFALAIDYIIMGLAPSIWLLVVGRLIAGVAGATFVTASAYISDVSPPEKRAANFGLVGAAFGVGFVVGPALGGLMGELGTRIPFFAAAGLAMLNFLYGLFILPESLPAAKRSPMSLRKSNPLAAILVVRRFPALGFLLASLFAFDVAHFVYPAIWSFWAKEVFGWTTGEIGMSLAAVGFGFALVQGYFIRFILPKLGEVRTTILSYGLTFVSLAAFGFVSQGWMVYALIPLTSFGAMATPALTGMLANSVSDDEQGMIQGVISGFAAIATIISPLIMNPLFYQFARNDAPIHLPGMPYLVSAALIVVACFCLLISLRESSIRSLGQRSQTNDDI